MFGSLFSSCCELPFLILYARHDVAAFSFPLSPSLSPPFSPSLLFLSPPCDQTQTQLEHARIRELEQSLLFEKAQAEKLLRELEDTRVIRSHLPCLQNSARPHLDARDTALGFILVHAVDWVWLECRHPRFLFGLVFLCSLPPWKW